tara:strand:- start:1241 stop:1438 length:198 start_codon:yes stop_codon:yes gene_type:complete
MRKYQQEEIKGLYKKYEKDEKVLAREMKRLMKKHVKEDKGNKTRYVNERKKENTHATRNEINYNV